MIPIKYTLQAENGNGLPVNLRADPSSHALVVISYPHHEIHDGEHFYAYKTASLTNGQILTLAITTTQLSKELHMFMDFNIATACLVEILEDCDAFTGGTSFTPLNNLRDAQGKKPSTVSVLTGHTGSTPITIGSGTEIWAQNLGAGNRAGGTLAHDAEIIFKRNSKYLFRITNSTTTQGVTATLQWYEHHNRSEL